jgi:hypothetical protein
MKKGQFHPIRGQEGQRGVQLRHASAALPPEKKPSSHFTGGWQGQRAGLDGCGKCCTRRDSDAPGREARTESLYRLRYRSPLTDM